MIKEIKSAERRKIINDLYSKILMVRQIDELIEHHLEIIRDLKAENKKLKEKKLKTKK
jgi:hypothetical protein